MSGMALVIWCRVSMALVCLGMALVNMVCQVEYLGCVRYGTCQYGEEYLGCVRYGTC